MIKCFESGERLSCYNRGPLLPIAAEASSTVKTNKPMLKVWHPQEGC